MKKLIFGGLLGVGISFARIICDDTCHGALNYFKVTMQYVDQSNDEIVLLGGKERVHGPIGTANKFLEMSCNVYGRMSDDQKRVFHMRFEHQYGASYKVYNKLCELGNIDILLIDENKY